MGGDAVPHPAGRLPQAWSAPRWPGLGLGPQRRRSTRSCTARCWGKVLRTLRVRLCICKPPQARRQGGTGKYSALSECGSHEPHSESAEYFETPTASRIPFGATGRCVDITRTEASSPSSPVVPARCCGPSDESPESNRRAGAKMGHLAGFPALSAGAAVTLANRGRLALQESGVDFVGWVALAASGTQTRLSARAGHPIRPEAPGCRPRSCRSARCGSARRRRRRTGRRRGGQVVWHDSRPWECRPSATAPAASVGPSSPSVPPLSTATPRIPSGPSWSQQRQHELLVPPALPGDRAERHRRFPADQDAHRRAERFAPLADVANDARDDRRDVLRFAFDERPEVEDAIPQLFGRAAGGGEGDGVGADHDVPHVRRAASSACRASRPSHPF